MYSCTNTKEMKKMIETSLMVDDYPTPPEEKTKTVDFEVYVKMTFKNFELAEDETPEDYINNNPCWECEYDEIEIESIE